MPTRPNKDSQAACESELAELRNRQSALSAQLRQFRNAEYQRLQAKVPNHESMVAELHRSS
eukprot:3429203-Rhodomonas_salina.3